MEIRKKKLKACKNKSHAKNWYHEKLGTLVGVFNKR